MGNEGPEPSTIPLEGQMTSTGMGSQESCHLRFTATNVRTGINSNAVKLAELRAFSQNCESGWRPEMSSEKAKQINDNELPGLDLLTATAMATLPRPVATPGHILTLEDVIN